MAEHIRHRLECGPATDLVGGYRVAEHVGARTRRRYASIFECLYGHGPTGLYAFDWTIWRTKVEKHCSLVAGRTAIFQVSGESFAGNFGQREDAPPVVLSGTHQQVSLPPVEILQAKTHYFASTESKACEQQKNRAVTKIFHRS